MKNPKYKFCRGKNYMHQQWQKAVAKNGKNLLEKFEVKGEEYHPNTLYNIAMMIQIYINEPVDNTMKII